MKNINLLPKIPRIRKIFWPVLTSAITIYLIIAITLFYTNFSTGSSIEEKNALVTRLNQEIQMLQAMRTPDPLAQDFNAFQKDVNTLKDHRRKWITYLDEISRYLPANSRITAMSVNNEGQFILEGQFKDLARLAEYIAKLSQYEQFESVNASKVERMELQPVQSDDVESSESTADVVDGIPEFPLPDKKAESNQAPISEEDLTKRMGEKITEPEDESEYILNELRWLMEQKAASQQYGIELPALNQSEPANIEDWIESGLFTEEEIKQAEQQLDDYKKTTVTPTMTDTEKLLVYNTTITITLIPLQNEEEIKP